jgi:hypothetical protein
MPVIHKWTNTPLPIFFIDIEPSPTNWYFKINYIVFY